MRLARVEHGAGWKHRLVFGLIRLTSGHRVPDVVRTLFFRSAFFGEPMTRLTQAVMRGPSTWSVAEREIVAAFVSRLNQCVF
jgi:hypothetical protein